MKQFYIGIKAIISDPERGILALHKPSESGGFWEVPGGRMDIGESFEQALLRELQEELPGITKVKMRDLLAAHNVTEPFTDKIGLVLLYFDVEATLPDELQLSDEHDGARFMLSANDVPKEMNTTLSNILTKLLG